MTGAPAAAEVGADSFQVLRADIDWGEVAGTDTIRWDAEGWVGGERNRLWLRTEGDVADSEIQKAEILALWGRAIAPSWDVVLGARFDIEPDVRTYLAGGFEGLAPYEFETALTAFLSENGVLSARFSAAIEVWLARRLALEPHLEINAHAQADGVRAIGTGIADAELGLQLRYNMTPRVAPYLDVVHERFLGETADIARAEGDRVERTSLRVGVRFGF